MNEALTVRCAFHVAKVARGRKQLEQGAPAHVAPLAAGRVPRVARLMALALRLQRQVQQGVFANLAEVARLGHVTTARVSQILSLVNLAPDLQEALLFLPRTEKGRDAVVLREVLEVAQEMDWKRQRRLWQRLL